MRSEAGSSLIEVVVSVALCALSLAAILDGSAAAARRFGPDPVRAALQSYLGREMRVAVDVLKYQGGSLSPAAVATTIPLPAGSPVAAHVSLSLAPLPDGGTAVTITARTDAAGTSASLEAEVAHPAPLPASTVQTGLSVPAPMSAQ